jgi:acyl-CoA synthetase (NDP forming)
MAAHKKVAEILSMMRESGRHELLEHESKKVLATWEIPTTRVELARDAAEAVKAARELKYPVVMKISSPNIIHKSDAGGVKSD